MRTLTSVCLIIAATAFPISNAMAATPFPPGYDEAYRAFARSLSTAGKKAAWLTQLNGVASQPKTVKINGKSVLYLFACKSHSCDTDNVNIFLAPNHKNFKAVLKMGGARTLLGGAGPAELSCVGKLDASGGAIDEC